MTSSNGTRVCRVLAITALLAGGSLGHATRVTAQGADIRDIRPVVMLLVDTSGSMEYRAGESTGTLPMCSGSATGVNQESRWTTVLEALTGEWSTYTCSTVDRREFTGAPDQYYYLPHHRPPVGGQDSNGVLDVYAERVKFGLMTFDTLFGLTSVPDELMVTQSLFASRLTDNAMLAGDFSYGLPRALTFPECGTTFMVDGGARNEHAPYGQLVSVGTDDDDYRVINATIQEQLLGTRPYGATPTAAMIDDFRFYLDTHSDVAPATTPGGDPLAECRPRFAILVTDGQPSDPYRGMGCDAPGYSCPYETPDAIAQDLCRFTGTPESGKCTGEVDGVFVVGFDVDDPAAEAALDLIAERGGTGAALMAQAVPDVDNPLTLLGALSAALDRAAPGTTTRTSPSFATGATTSTGGGSQFLFSSGFDIPGNVGEPWSGVLDRTRFECGPDLLPTRRPIDPGKDSFHTILNERDVASSPRTLYTVVTPQPNQMRGIIMGTDAGLAPMTGTGGSPVVHGHGPPTPAPTRVTGLELSSFDTSNGSLTPAHFGFTSGNVATRAARRDAIINWVHGREGTARFGNRFGDIYHSTPVAVGPPRSDIADESYNLFRRRPDVATRPTVVYVGTNDGVLHAFATEDMRVGSRQLTAGEEIWGFVPPGVISRLESATVSHQVLVDGPPVVRDVFYMRLPGAAPTADERAREAYRTVLVMGLRGGGNYYFALDVTDPLDPKFLWQFTDRYMGQTFARPTIGQVLVKIGGQLQERAIALLPGGRGDIDLERVRTAGPVGCPSQGNGQPPENAGTLNARSHQRCWSQIGRQLHWVDIVTGETLFSFDGSVFSAPVTGGISMFTGDTGTIATRAFVTDEDGMIWRIDFSSPDTAEWTAERFHDIFYDGDATSGQPAYEPPVLSTDANGNVVILQATGNIDQLDGTALNRVVSLRECLPGVANAGACPAPGTTTKVTSALNWEIRLRPGEQVTGPIDLYEGVAYFGSFESSSSSDPCDYGQSRIWGVGYLEATSTAPAGYDAGDAFPTAQMQTEEFGAIDAHFIGPFEDSMVLGVQVTQQLTCVTGVPTDDPYLGAGYDVTATGASQFQLTAQMNTPGAVPAGMSSVRSITRTLPAPASYTRVLSWVPQADQ